MPEKNNVLFIGLGAMGWGIAGNLAARGGERQNSFSSDGVESHLR